MAGRCSVFSSSPTGVLFDLICHWGTESQRNAIPEGTARKVIDLRGLWGNIGPRRKKSLFPKDRGTDRRKVTSTVAQMWNPSKLPKRRSPGAEQTVCSFPCLSSPVLTGKVCLVASALPKSAMMDSLNGTRSNHSSTFHRKAREMAREAGPEPWPERYTLLDRKMQHSKWTLLTEPLGLKFQRFPNTNYMK